MASQSRSPEFRSQSLATSRLVSMETVSASPSPVLDDFDGVLSPAADYVGGCSHCSGDPHLAFVDQGRLALVDAEFVDQLAFDPPDPHAAFVNTSQVVITA